MEGNSSERVRPNDWDGGNNKICPGFSDEKICDRQVSLTRCKKDKKKWAESRADSNSTEWRGGRERKGMTAAREGNSLERVSVGMAATIRSALGLVKKKNATDRCRSLETERTGCKKDKKIGRRG